MITLKLSDGRTVNVEKVPGGRLSFDHGNLREYLRPIDPLAAPLHAMYDRIAELEALAADGELFRRAHAATVAGDPKFTENVERLTAGWSDDMPPSMDDLRAMLLEALS